MGHEPVIAAKVREDGAGFGAGKDDGHLRRAGNALDSADELEFPLEHMLVEKEEGAKGLVLSGGGDAAVHGEMAQEGSDFLFAHVAGVTFLVEEDEAPDPVEVGLLGADAVALNAEVPANLVEEFARRRRGLFSGDGLGNGKHG